MVTSGAVASSSTTTWAVLVLPATSFATITSSVGSVTAPNDTSAT